MEVLIANCIVSGTLLVQIFSICNNLKENQKTKSENVCPASLKQKSFSMIMIKVPHSRSLFILHPLGDTSNFRDDGATRQALHPSLPSDISLIMTLSLDWPNPWRRE